MPRSAAASLGFLLACCAAPEAPPDGGFGDAGYTVLDPTPPSPVAETAPGNEGDLRRELASAGDPTEAALELVRLLDREERLPEALLVLDVARQKRPAEAALLVARAGVLRDLGRRAEALQDLTAAVAGAAAGAVAPALLFEWAELAALHGEFAVARTALDRLLGEGAGVAAREQAFLAQHRDEVARLQECLANRQRLRPARVRDLLGELRGGAVPADRLQAFTVLQKIGGPIGERAVAAILGDADPDLRAAGVRAAAVATATLPEFCAVALTDPAAAVRAAGAERAASLPQAEAVALLLPILRSETDAMAFAALHQALRQSTGTGAALTAAAAADPAVRAQHVLQWRSQWEK